MREVKDCCLKGTGILLACILFISAKAQVLQQIVARPGVAMDATTAGYYESLPVDYNTSNKKYPLIVFIHGLGEIGNGTSDLSTVLRNGLPRVIQNGKFPSSFTVNNQSYSFIVVAPQFKEWAYGNFIDAILNYCISNYRVDQQRIYITGLSMGGSTTWNAGGGVRVTQEKMGERLAAIVPVCGASEGNDGLAKNIATTDLPVWATHNDGDPTVSVNGTLELVKQVNLYAPGNALAKKTIFHQNSHDAWTQTYDPAFKEDGLNIYEWMLTKIRSANIILPVVLKYFNAAVREGKVALTWITTMEENNDYFTLERSSDGTHFEPISTIAASDLFTGSTYQFTDASPAEGVNYYRLSQTDKNKKSTFLETTTAVIDKGNKTAMTVYPNLVYNTVNISLDDVQKGKLDVTILSSDGKIRYTHSFLKQQTRWTDNITVSSLQPGYYWLKVNIGSTIQTKSFIKK